MMKTNTIVHLLALVGLAFVLLLAIMPTSSAYAFEPPWPAGIPWPTSAPWPTANPLQIGVPWSPSQQTYPVYIPTPAAPAPQTYSVYGPTPLPPIGQQSQIYSAPAPLPPIAPQSIAPTPLPPISSPSYPNNPPPAVAPPAPVTYNGSTRSSALEPSDSFRTLNAGTSVWYIVGTSGDHIDVWLEANPLGGVSMAIYAPNGSDKPVGHGSPDNSNRLVWSGGHWEGGGNWYAQITNSNPVAVQYRIQTSARNISNKSCYSYWEYIGPNLVYWTQCNN